MHLFRRKHKRMKSLCGATDHQPTKQHTFKFKYTWCTFYGRKDKVLDEAREGESNGLTNKQHSNKHNL
jgi:hypothetical protein